jgi:hypothetical protein
MKKLRLLPVVMTLWLTTGAAYACDAKLSDVSVKNYTQQTDIVRQLYVFNLAKKTYSEASDKKNGDVSYNGVDVNASEEQHRRFAESIQESTYANTFLDHSSEIIKSYGDPNLLAGYLACLAQDGGIQIRLQDRGPLQALLTITYHHAPGGPMAATVRRVTNLNGAPGITLETNGGCLQAGAVLESNNPCVSTLRFDSATRPLLVAINTTAGAGSAFIPPRIRLVSKTKPIPDAYTDAAGGRVKFITTNSQSGDIVSSVGCTAPFEDGYWIGSSVKITASCHPQYPCTFAQGDLFNQTPDKVCVQLSCGHSGGRFTACTATVNGSINKLEWVPK